MPDKSPCDECAFRPGAGAHEEPYNRLRGMICAHGSVPFFCHHGIDWRAQHTPEFIARGREMARRTGVCQGWKVEVARLNSTGFFNDGFRSIRHAIAKQCLQTIDLFTNAKGREKKRLRNLLRRMVAFVCSRNIARKKIPLLWG